MVSYMDEPIQIIKNIKAKRSLGESSVSYDSVVTPDQKKRPLRASTIMNQTMASPMKLNLNSARA